MEVYYDLDYKQIIDYKKVYKINDKTYMFVFKDNSKYLFTLINKNANIYHMRIYNALLDNKGVDND